MAWETKTKIGSLPLLSIGTEPFGVIAIGVNGAGIIYIGWVGGGVISITQFGVGFICISQAGVGVFAAGQMAVGIFSIGQLALGLVYSIGQAAVGFISVGYGASFGYYDFTARGNIFSEIQKSISIVRESPEPLIYWSVVWGFLIFFITANWEKLRYGWSFLDFFRPLNRHSRYRARLEAVQETDDQEDLENMGRYDPHPKVRIEAIKKVESRNVLMEIATGRSKPSVRLAAIDRISSGESLRTIVLGDAPKSVKLAAVRRIDDEDILLDILKNAADTGIRSDVVKRIENEKKLAEAGLNDSSSTVKRSIIDKVNNQEALVKLVMTETDNKIIGRIISRITDDSMISEIALKAGCDRARAIAVKRILDYDLLTKIRSNDKSIEVQNAADKILKKYRPVYSFMNLKFDCPNCSQPVFPGGPLLQPECSYCFNKVNLTEKFWKELIGEPFVSESYSVMGGSYNNINVQKGEKSPRCLKCGGKLSIPDEKVGTVHSIKCSSCGYQNPSYPAPGWLKKLEGKKKEKQVSGNPVQVYCAWHEESDVTKKLQDIKPVAIACVQCGGTLKITVDSPRNPVCPYCSTSQYLPDPLWRILHPVTQKHSWYIRWAPLLEK